MAEATKLVVVRHGETAWNEVGRQQGWLDAELTERGRAQAQAIAEALAGQDFDLLYSSDLGRAMETAKIIADRLGMEVVVDARLRERNLGIMQGLTMAEFERRYPNEYALFRGGDPDYAIPEGESIRQRYERHVACAEELASRNGGLRLLLVAHGGVLNSFFRRATGQDIASPRRFSLYNASINAFTIADGEWSLDLWGDTHHLERLGTKDDS